jgi:catechol 2,3-dioxygenase-like lactoylglutathione lyase family enzyme
MSAMRLALVILAVEDLARSGAFYRSLTSWPVPIETPVYVELASPNGFRLGLYDRRSFGKNIGRVPEPIAGPVATTEVYLYVDDLDEIVRHAVTTGARLLDDARERPWGDRVAYFADPDGYVVALATRPDVRRPFAPGRSEVCTSDRGHAGTN